MLKSESKGNNLRINMNLQGEKFKILLKEFVDFVKKSQDVKKKYKIIVYIQTRNRQ